MNEDGIKGSISMEKEDARLLGYWLVDGALGRILSLALICIVTWIALGAISNLRGWGTDDSDLSGIRRSGVKVVTDYKTGLQYLESQHGGLVPRMAPDGSQMTWVSK